MPFDGLEFVEAERFAEDFADIATLFPGDLFHFTREGIGEADGEDARGSGAGAHMDSMTCYDIVVQILTVLEAMG